MSSTTQPYPYNEETLLNMASKGSLDAFNQLVLTYQNIAYYHAYALLRDSALAEDVTQDSFIRALQNIIEVAILTGDSQVVAKAVANQLGIQRVFAEVLPEHKDQKVIELQQQGRRVAMVGDDVNDAPALTRADVGIAIGGGTDVAIESAGLILVNSNPLDVVKIFRLSRASYSKMIQNLW